MFITIKNRKTHEGSISSIDKMNRNLEEMKKIMNHNMKVINNACDDLDNVTNKYLKIVCK